MRLSARLLACALACAAAPAAAGPKEDVLAASEKLMAARTYHVDMTHDAGGAQGMGNQIDFAAPDRYRMQTPMGTQYIIGDTMVMTIEGRSMKVPMGKGTMTQWRDPTSLRSNAAKVTVTALGADTLDGKPARKYRMVNAGPPATDSTMWIGGNGYPLQIVVKGALQGKATTTTIRYSRFNDPAIRVEPPK